MSGVGRLPERMIERAKASILASAARSLSVS